MRTTNSSVTFKHPFTLSGIDHMCAPGTYDLEIDEESIGALSFLAYRRIGTRITIGPTANTPGRTTTYVIDQRELAEALSRDEAEGTILVTGIRDFIRAGGGLTDAELATMIRTTLIAVPAVEQRNWMSQIELSLDGYGGERQLVAVGRVKNILRDLEAELRN